VAADVLVLGPVTLAGEAGPQRLPAKLRRLLAALVVADGRPCRADELVDVLWSEEAQAPVSAPKLIRIYVSQLRKLLPPEVAVETASGGYALRVSEGALDAARFERLLEDCRAGRRDGNAVLAASLAEQALSLWRGRAYGELADEEFARAESERLEELRLVAVEERLDAQLALGRQAEFLGEALAHALESPFRERAHELAMLALYRSGRQTDALEHFTTVRTRLRHELGLEPGPALRELQRRMLQQDPDLLVVAELAAAEVDLPVPPNPLVGRERELDELDRLLAGRDARLIVLTGAGGSGKTRLALEAARRAAGSFANGARLVELAPLHDAALVVPTIARALDVADDPEKEPLEALAAALAPQELLLLVDNAEHVREAASSFARLAAQAPRLTLLVTSRAVLHVSGEHVFPVAPLAEEDAVELFVQRAGLLEPTFVRTPENDADIREVCRRVDCLPLAIELAAARIRTLTPQALGERLDRRLRLLTSGPRDLPARQRTLRETIAWSVDLLGVRERDIFAQIAVFPGGASLDAAEAVCGADIDSLAALVDDHLLRREDVAGEPRFGMLETVREYALELLGEERTRAELALARHFAQLVDDLRLSDEREWAPALERLDPEIDNLRAALTAAEASEESELQLRLAGGLWRFWWVRGFPAEGLGWIERALAASDGAATVARARALQGGGGLAWSLGDLERARELALAAIPVAVDAGSKWDEASAHTVLGVVANNDGDRVAARRHHQRSLELTEELGFEPVIQKLNLGIVAMDAGESETAMALFEDVLESHRRHERPAGIGFALLNLGLLRHGLGDHESSRRDFEEARACLEEVGLRTQLAYALQGLAAAEATDAHYEQAAALLREARRELDEVGSGEDSFAPEMVAATKTLIRAALGDAAFERLYAGGRDQDG
jgi:predicted ATPase/DNA-binding SARP family transcriptional activator